MSDKKTVLVLTALVIIILGGGVYIVSMFLSSSSGGSPRTKSGIVIVNLPKAPLITEKEKPPEQPVNEIQRKVEVTPQENGEIVDSGPNIGSQNTGNTPAEAPALTGDAQGSDNTPAGDRLGLDTEGKAGSDAFGLVGRRGGRSILAGGGKVGGGGSGNVMGGGFGKGSLLKKFGWYTQIVKNEISKKVQKHLDENGGIPRGKLQTLVRISVNNAGDVVQCQIIGSSGNHGMDEAVKQCVNVIKISEPPPEGMPRTMIVRVTSQSG